MHDLMQQYGMMVVEASRGPISDKLVIANGTTGLVIEVDKRELRPFVTLYRRSSFDKPPRGAWDQRADDIGAFDVDDLFYLRNPSSSPVGLMFADAGEKSVAHLLSMYASAIGEAGDDLLKGDFSVLLDVQHRVNDRRLER